MLVTGILIFHKTYPIRFHILIIGKNLLPICRRLFSGEHRILFLHVHTMSALDAPSDPAAFKILRKAQCCFDHTIPARYREDRYGSLRGSMQVAVNGDCACSHIGKTFFIRIPLRQNNHSLVLALGSLQHRHVLAVLTILPTFREYEICFWQR